MGWRDSRIRGKGLEKIAANPPQLEKIAANPPQLKKIAANPPQLEKIAANLPQLKKNRRESTTIEKNRRETHQNWKKLLEFGKKLWICVRIGNCKIELQGLGFLTMESGGMFR